MENIKQIESKVLLKWEMKENEGKIAFPKKTKFEKLLKDSKMKLTMFAVGFDQASNQYHVAYQMESKKHKNAPLRIDRKFDFNIPFAFVPSAFPDWLRATLNDLPTNMIATVASGG